MKDPIQINYFPYNLQSKSKTSNNYIFQPILL
nr:MAG TPA: hypothetical protein [Caudoviricetes sp.]